ncbi:MAG: hypothetical protein HS132_19280 [Planctomycetia bacterium]|nr:hypothetical protein [Planctomycetia bacterium]
MDPARSQVRYRKIYHRARLSNVKQARRIHRVIVATDNRLIYDIVKGFGDVEMTSVSHTSGTDRIAEVAGRLDADIVVNVQGMSRK